MSCASSRHITKLKQSIFAPFDIYVPARHGQKHRCFGKKINKLVKLFCCFIDGTTFGWVANAYFVYGESNVCRELG
jgi:hypothetical protein